MAQENVEIVRRVYQRWGTGGFEAAAPDLDPHVMFVVRPPFPESGIFVGLGSIGAYMQEFLKQWARFTLEPTDLQAVGDTVVARVAQRSKGRASGIDTEGTYFMLFTFRGGKILWIETVLDEGEALEAAGLSE